MRAADWSMVEWLTQIRARCVVDEGGCWVWPGAVTRRGAPRWNVCAGLEVRVHRQAWRAVKGPIPPGYVLVNQCGERRCCRPAHYQCVSRAEHALSELAAGRGAQGALLGLAVARSWKRRPDLKMSEQRAAQMRELRAQTPTPTYDELAKKFGVSRGTVYWVVTNKRWVKPSPWRGLT